MLLSQLRALYNGGAPLTVNGLMWSYVVTFVNIGLSRCLLPKNVEDDGQDVYLNVNLSREVWKDVARFKFLAVKKDSAVDPGGYVWGVGWRWCVFNTVSFGVMKGAYAVAGL